MPSPPKATNERGARIRTWRQFWERRVLRPEDGDLLKIAERLQAELSADRGGKANLTAAEAALISQVGVAVICQCLCLQEVGRAGDGGFHTAEDGSRAASSALKELPKFLGAARQALQVLGTDKRAGPAVSLREYLQQQDAGRLPKDAPIPAEIVSEEPAK